MPAMTAQEFDRVLAAFSFVLERAIAEPPAYYDPDRLADLRDEIEEIRLGALEREAEAQLSGADLESQVVQWISKMSRQAPSDK